MTLRPERTSGPRSPTQAHRADTARRQDTADRVREIRSIEAGQPRRRQTGDIRFSGFHALCTKTRRGWSWLGRKTKRKKRQAKLTEVRLELRRRMHDRVPERGRYVDSVVRGHANYYGIPGNSRAIARFRTAVIRSWRKTLSRPSQKGTVPWRRMATLVERYVPRALLKYTNPDGYLALPTRGRSPVR